jgi:uncharacterized protein (DUF849 family)
LGSMRVSGSNLGFEDGTLLPDGRIAADNRDIITAARA